VTDFISRLKALSNGANNSRKPARRRSVAPEYPNGQDAEPLPPSNSPVLKNPNGATVSQDSRLGRPSPSDSSQTRPNPPKFRKPMYQRWWVWVILGVSAGVGGAAISAIAAVRAIQNELPDPSAVMTYTRDGTLTIKAADGSVLQQLGPATRQKLKIDDMPSMLIKAFVASEDQHFYEHEGVDLQAIARAALANISAGEVVEGASTITQQLARIVFLDQDRSLDRKVREALLAQKIEGELSKSQILERYLNLVYLGSGAYGVADAAWVYFSKPVDKLTLSEMAMIAGMPPAPSAYSPLVNPEVAKQRRNIVLQRMVEVGYISQAQMDEAIAAPLTLKPSLPRNLYSEMPYFTSYIQQQLPNYVSKEDLEIGGLTVETTLNPKWQRLAQDTVSYAIEAYGPGQNFTQAALVCIDPRTGAIKALVGGNDFNKSQFNRATQAQRQPGSTFKVFVYTTAIAGGISPNKTYVDAKFVVDGYEPNNYSKGYRGAVTLREALASSINIVAVKVLIEAGFKPVIDMAHRMGIKSELQPTYSLALGASEVNLLELTSAYGTLANKGNHVEPHGIVRITNRFGEVLYEAEFKPERAVDERTAAIMTSMLRSVVQGGTGARAQLGGRPVAGKTGTSEQRRDLWFVGYIPQVVTGIWLGNDNNRPTWGASSTAARTWRNFMSDAVDGMPVENFPDPGRLRGRRATVTLQPVKPRRIRASRAEERRDSDDDAPRASDRSERQRSERSRSDNAEPQIDKERNSSGSNDSGASNSAPPPQPQAAPVEPAAEPAPPPMVVPVEPAAEPAPPPPAATTP
jgi:penicillin-binding protein 1A